MDLANNRGLNLLLNFVLIIMVLLLMFILVKLLWDPMIGFLNHDQWRPPWSVQATWDLKDFSFRRFLIADNRYDTNIQSISLYLNTDQYSRDPQYLYQCPTSGMMDTILEYLSVPEPRMGLTWTGHHMTTLTYSIQMFLMVEELTRKPWKELLVYICQSWAISRKQNV